MLNNSDNRYETEQSREDSEKKSRKPYHKPLLEELGDLRTLTLGGSVISPGDSGGFGTLYDYF